MIEVFLRKGGSVKLVGKGGKTYKFELNQRVGVADNDNVVMEKIQRLNTQITGKFEVTADLLPELLPKDWRKLNSARLRTLAVRFGLGDAEDTKRFPNRESVIEVLDQMVDDKVIGVEE